MTRPPHGITYGLPINMIMAMVIICMKNAIRLPSKVFWVPGVCTHLSRESSSTQQTDTLIAVCVMDVQ